jgi:UDP-glucose 4-epimerase
MRVLVSGGTGLVGRYIVDGLLAAGYAVTVGGRRQPEPLFFPAPTIFTPLALDPDADQTEAFDSADAFVHLAFSHVPGLYRGGEGDDPQGFRRLNLDGSVRLFQDARRAGVRRCVFLSSRAVYGDSPVGTLLSEATEPAPTTLYGEVKREAERALFALASPDFAAISLRATGVYGDLRPNKWDGLFADYLAGRPGPARAGTEVHGRDLALAIRLMLETDAAAVSGAAFNVSDIRTDTHEILEIVRDVMRSRHHLPPPAAHAIAGEMDTARIRALGWSGGGRPLLEDTIRKLCETAGAFRG